MKQGFIGVGPDILVSPYDHPNSDKHLLTSPNNITT